MVKRLKDLDFKDVEVRKEFIHKNESGFYVGKATDGTEVEVLLEQGEELTVKWINSKGWYEGKTYDSEGEFTDDVLEKAYK